MRAAALLWAARSAACPPGRRPPAGRAAAEGALSAAPTCQGCVTSGARALSICVGQPSQHASRVSTCCCCNLINRICIQSSHVPALAELWCVQHLQEVTGLFPTIEDYMWFQLALVRSGSGSSEGEPPSGSGAVQPATLEAMQHYLQQYPPAHYSHQGGKDVCT